LDFDILFKKSQSIAGIRLPALHYESLYLFKKKQKEKEKCGL